MFKKQSYFQKDGFRFDVNDYEHARLRPEWDEKYNAVYRSQLLRAPFGLLWKSCTAWPTFPVREHYLRSDRGTLPIFFKLSVAIVCWHASLELCLYPVDDTDLS